MQLATALTKYLGGFFSDSGSKEFIADLEIFTKANFSFFSILYVRSIIVFTGSNISALSFILYTKVSPLN